MTAALEISADLVLPLDAVTSSFAGVRFVDGWTIEVLGEARARELLAARPNVVALVTRPVASEWTPVEDGPT